MNRLKIFITLFLSLTSIFLISAEDDGGRNSFNPVTVSVPSLTIAPDARGGGMGDVGAATESDVYSQYWNPAKYAFAYSKAGVGLTYTPWLRSLVDDIDLVYLSGYYKLGDTDRSAVSGALRYFSLGYVPITDENAHEFMSTNPYEMSAEVSYSMKFSETFSGAATFRFIYSDLGAGVEELYPGTAWAADIAGYYNNYIMMGNSESLLGLGFNVSNIGTKISYDSGNTNYFIPTNLRLGASLLMPLDEYNTLSLNLDANKYLVPTPPDLDNLDEAERNDALENYRAISPITGIFKSFNDAPGGMKEELQEIMWSAGAEYAYDRKFFVRGGYFYENPNKGNRQYFSVGAGFKMTAFQLDIAYLISTVPSNPLDKTLRISLSFDMDGLKGMLK
jgi:hypothetical protein